VGAAFAIGNDTADHQHGSLADNAGDQSIRRRGLDLTKSLAWFAQYRRNKPQSAGQASFKMARLVLNLWLLGIYGLRAVVNPQFWIWALARYWRLPLPLRIALLAYRLGLRHASTPTMSPQSTT
jgi:hypothetical protein